jgi:quercetin dioxygenase-like cupin family protein
MPLTILTGNVYKSMLPVTLSKEEKTKHVPIFKGLTAGLLEFSCHLSIHMKGHCPHELHSHENEEILYILSGSIKLKHADNNCLKNKEGSILNKDQFVYYPANYPHTFIASSDMPATCLALHWKTDSVNKNTGLDFTHFTVPENLDNKDNKAFFAKTLFEGPTLYLNKLHCHNSIINPGGSVKTHTDNYDVFSIILEGEVETLGRKAKPYDIIFYPTGTVHGLYNSEKDKARELVFEFHTNKVFSIKKTGYLVKYYFRELKNIKFWKKKVKRIAKILLPEAIYKVLKNKYRRISHKR